MGLNFTSCHYHPDKIAVTICERCRRPICLEDKRIYRKRHTRGSGDNASYYYTHHEYCVLCNASQLRLDANPYGLLFFIPFALIFFIIFGGVASGFNGAGSIFIAFFGIFFVIILIISLGQTMSTRSKAQNAEQEALEFKSTLYSKSDSSSRPSFKYDKKRSVPEIYDDDFYERSPKEIKKSDDLFSIVCFECGTHINLEDKYCQNCGDSTHDELINYYKLHKPGEF